MKTQRINARRSLAAFALSALIATGSIGVRAAAAADTSTLGQVQASEDSLAARIEETTVAYREAADEVARIEAEIAKNADRAAEIEAQLPAQRARTAASIRELYKFKQSQSSMVSLMLSSADFEEFISTLHYLSSINERNMAQISALTVMSDELSQKNALLQAQREDAAQRQLAAEAALVEARAARVELQEKAALIAASEAESRETAIHVAAEEVLRAEAADEEPTFTTASGYETEIKMPAAFEHVIDSEAYVNNITADEVGDWAARIDAYLEGSPLEGYGQVFADAAAAYGVDPRLSPAISCIESSKGTYCFLPHNAWGWGSSSWNDWEEAIYEHVEGLAVGYDGILTYEGAQRYCPPTADEWYTSVGSEMGLI